jgi:hypothetical protein
MKKNYDGIAIVIAWPETYCKQAGAWYDRPMRWLGFCVDYYYQAGHAAVVLVEKKTGYCRYFDFGRYHSPFGYGRARSAETDPELAVRTVAIFNGNSTIIINVSEILTELQSNKSCHGDGTVYSSQIPINYSNSIDKAISIQREYFLRYGPFIPNGSNCSRFVRNVVQAGKPPIGNLVFLKFFVPLTPTTLSNVKAGNYALSLPKFDVHGEIVSVARPNFRSWVTSANWLKETFPAPKPHSIIPKEAQWLSGEGYGSWFYLASEGGIIQLKKYSPSGIIECISTFSFVENGFNFDQNFRITYPSNAEVITVIQNDKIYSFKKET